MGKVKMIPIDRTKLDLALKEMNVGKFMYADIIGAGEWVIKNAIDRGTISASVLKKMSTYPDRKYRITYEEIKPEIEEAEEKPTEEPEKQTTEPQKPQEFIDGKKIIEPQDIAEEVRTAVMACMDTWLMNQKKVFKEALLETFQLLVIGGDLQHEIEKAMASQKLQNTIKAGTHNGYLSAMYTIDRTQKPNGGGGK